MLSSNVYGEREREVMRACIYSLFNQQKFFFQSNGQNQETITTISSNHKPIKSKAIATKNKYIKSETNIGKSWVFYQMLQQHHRRRICLCMYDANFIFWNLCKWSAWLVFLGLTIPFPYIPLVFFFFFHYHYYYYYFRYIWSKRLINSCKRAMDQHHDLYLLLSVVIRLLYVAFAWCIEIGFWPHNVPIEIIWWCRRIHTHIQFDGFFFHCFFGWLSVLNRIQTV